MKEKFSIDGMTCASCVMHVTNAVKKLDGVNNVEVSLVSNSMIVDYNQDESAESTIIQAVDKAGYKARIYQSISSKTEDESRRRKLKKQRNTMWISASILVILMVFSMWHMFAMEYSWPFITDLIGNTGIKVIVVIGVELGLSIPILILNYQYFVRGFKALFTFHPNMDSLVATGSSVSFIYGVYIFIKVIVGYISGEGSSLMTYMNQIYIESAATILVFVSIGKYLESKATNKTKSALDKLASLTPATIFIQDGNIEREIDINLAKIGDLAVVRSGQSVPADGVIVKGYGNIDESMITGESLPKYVKIGEKVKAGTVNKEGYFVFRIQKLLEDTDISKIAEMVKQAADSKTPLSQLADRISMYFVPGVILAAVIVFLSWLFATGLNFDKAIEYGVSVLVVSCPCALGLATPIAITAGSGKGATHGILFRSGEAFERLNKADVIVFDKTGTLTRGTMEVKSILLKGMDENEAYRILYSLEMLSEHPLSKAIVNYTFKSENERLDVSDFVYVPGKGIKGFIKDELYLVGNKELLADDKIRVDRQIYDEFEKMSIYGNTVLFFANSDGVLGLLSIGDSSKEDSAEAIATLNKLGIKTVMLTGDNSYSAKAIADKLGVSEYKSDCLPKDKEKYIADLQKQGLIVAMVGDGINDAPSLTKADVGIAVGSGTDIAIQSADIIIMKSDISDVVYAYELSKATVRMIHLNLFWAFFYNVIMIPIAAGSLTGVNFVLSPMLASLAMSLSSVTVVLNSLRLNLFHKKEDESMLFKIKKSEGVKQVLSIDGMMCEHCVGHVKEALQKLDGVKDVQVDLKKGQAVIVSDKAIGDEELSRSITEAGYVLSGVARK